jgi:hypothetical protein
MASETSNPATRETGRARKSFICLAAKNGTENSRSLHQAQDGNDRFERAGATGGAQ